MVNSIDLTDFSTKLAAKVGILDGYNDAINAGLLGGVRLRGKGFNYALEPDV